MKFYKLIEVLVKKNMLVEIRDQCILKIIDPPTVPVFKAEPKRLLIGIFAVVVGMTFT